jgi:hypothetical protein
MLSVPEKTCFIEGCGNLNFARGFCNKHYQKLLKHNGPFPRFTLEERFWSKVDIKSESECWNWKAFKNNKGYGQFTIYKQTIRSHRFSYQLSYGEIPEDKIIRHKCDNPSCVNPKHLEIGTHVDNVADRVNRGRSLFGERHPRTILTEVEVIEILGLKSKARAKDLGTKYGVGEGTIHNIWARRSWAHLPV